MYLTGVGYGMVFAGIYIRDINDADVPRLNSPNLLFAGGFLTTLFWVYKTNKCTTTIMI